MKAQGLPKKQVEALSEGYRAGMRELSWSLGDEHADRICKLIDLYVKLFRLRNRSWHYG